MDKTVGRGRITQTFDLKHIIKRLRTRDKCKTKGMKVAMGASLNTETTIPLFNMFYDRQSWNSLFQPDDSLIKKMAEVGLTTAKEIPGFKGNVFLMKIHKNLRGVGTLLESLSCVAHMLLHIFRDKRTAFVPAQFYHDPQAFIRSAFFIVAQAIHLFPDLPFFMFQIGTDRLEQVLAFVRKVTHHRNCNVSELCDCRSAAYQLAGIWDANPTWRRPSKRLTSTKDHMNNTL